MNKLKFILKDTFIYGGTIALNSLIMLMTIPLLTNNFSVDEYGLIDLYLTLITILVILFVFAQDSTIARFFYEFNSNRRKKKLISESFYFQNILYLVFLPIIYFVVLSYFEQVDKKLLLLILLQVPFFILLNFSQNILKWTFQRSKFIFISLGSTLFILIFLQCYITFFSIDIYDVLYIYLISRLIFSLIGLFFVRKWIIKIYNFESLKFLIPYGVPILLISLITLGLPFTERLFLLKILSEYELGLYSVALKVVFFISLPIQAFQMAWGPFLYTHYKDEKNYVLFNFIFMFIALFLLILLVLVLIFSKELVYLLSSEEYIESTKILFTLCLSPIILAIGSILEAGIDLSKKSYLKYYGFISSALIGIFLTYLIIKYFGFYYAGWGVLIGNICKVLIDYTLARKVYNIIWNYHLIFNLNIFIIILQIINIYIYEHKYDLYFNLFILFILFIFLIRTIYVHYLMKIFNCKVK